MKTANELAVITKESHKERSIAIRSNIEKSIGEAATAGNGNFWTHAYTQMNKDDLENFVNDLRSNGYDIEFSGPTRNMIITWCKENLGIQKEDLDRLNK